MRRRAFLGAVAAGAVRARRSLAAPREILVLAAASLTDAVTEIGTAFTQARGERVGFGFAGSGELARQVLAGAPADVFVSADELAVDQLQRAGRVAAADRCELLSNRLVVVVPAASRLHVGSARDLAAARRIAVADPAIVPAGRYARRWLEAAGAWPLVSERLVPVLDVRAALAAAEAQLADAAIVYATDARLSRRARVAFAVPASEAPAIRYVAVRLTPAGRVFHEHLRSAEARAVFERFGFEPLTPAAAPGRGGGSAATRSRP